jgi:hypothetical protein
MNRPNIPVFLGVKPKRKTLYTIIKALAEKKQKSKHGEKIFCLVCEETCDEIWIQCEGCRN